MTVPLKKNITKNLKKQVQQEIERYFINELDYHLFRLTLKEVIING